MHRADDLDTVGLAMPRREKKNHGWRGGKGVIRL